VNHGSFLHSRTECPPAASIGIVIEPVTVEQAQVARQAFHDFGRGRHAAGLNFGDCFAYALAKITDEPRSQLIAYRLARSRPVPLLLRRGAPLGST